MTDEELTVSVVVKMYQGIIEDVIVFKDIEAANRCFQEWIHEHISKADLEQMGEKTALEYSDINGSTVYSACAVDFIPAKKASHEVLKQEAHRIIDLEEAKICYDNPQVDLLRGQHKGNTLLYGKGYYELEDEVVKVLKELTGNG